MLSVKINHSEVLEDNEEILKDVEFDVKPSKITLLMGPNGSGKSTLLKSILNHPDYKTTGEINVGKDNFKLPNFETQDLIKSGVGYISQKNPEIDGLKLGNLALAVGKEFIGSTKRYKKEIKELIDEIGIDKSFLKRELTNFSGGERKRIELMLTLLQNPDYILIDEIDSGLDLDSLSLISKVIGKKVTNGLGVFIITHNGNIAKEILSSSNISKEDFEVLVLKSGSIAKKGDYALIKELEEKGYSHF
ncbi:MAG: ATP-binding cassette domain-containing protein [Candidatus Woesearchaeota archaeon]